MSIRDPNKINSANREQWLARSLAGMKKIAERPAANLAIAPKVAASANSVKTPPANLTKVAPASPAPEPIKTEMAKPESLGPVDFTGRQIVRGIANTREFRYKLGKQIRGAIGKSISQRSAVMKNFTDRMSSSGKMNVRDAKHAIWNSGLTRGQEQRLMKHLGI